jgi:hypothetical protein
MIDTFILFFPRSKRNQISLSSSERRMLHSNKQDGRLDMGRSSQINNSVLRLSPPGNRISGIARPADAAQAVSISSPESLCVHG